MSDEWDWELQQNQTAYTVAELIKQNASIEGVNITLDMEYEPVEGADKATLEKALRTFGYDVIVSSKGAIQASISDIPFTFESIWTHEERTTKMALSRGYQPDGWGFWEP